MANVSHIQWDSAFSSGQIINAGNHRLWMLLRRLYEQSSFYDCDRYSQGFSDISEKIWSWQEQFDETNFKKWALGPDGKTPMIAGGICDWLVSYLKNESMDETVMVSNILSSLRHHEQKRKNGSCSQSRSKSTRSSSSSSSKPGRKKKNKNKAPDAREIFMKNELDGFAAANDRAIKQEEAPPQLFNVKKTNKTPSEKWQTGEWNELARSKKNKAVIIYVAFCALRVDDAYQIDTALMCDIGNHGGLFDDNTVFTNALSLSPAKYPFLQRVSKTDTTLHSGSQALECTDQKVMDNLVRIAPIQWLKKLHRYLPRKIRKPVAENMEANTLMPSLECDEEDVADGQDEEKEMELMDKVSQKHDYIGPYAQQYYNKFVVKKNGKILDLSCSGDEDEQCEYEEEVETQCGLEAEYEYEEYAVQSQEVAGVMEMHDTMNMMVYNEDQDQADGHTVKEEDSSLLPASNASQDTKEEAEQAADTDHDYDTDHDAKMRVNHEEQDEIQEEEYTATAILASTASNQCEVKDNLEESQFAEHEVQINHVDVDAATDLRCQCLMVLLRAGEPKLFRKVGKRLFGFNDQFLWQLFCETD